MICVSPANPTVLAAKASNENVKRDLGDGLFFLPSRGFSITGSCHLLIHTCYFGDALQFGDRQSDN